MKEFDLFDALAAIDTKQYDYYDSLSSEQQRKFIPFMLLHWVSAINSRNANLQTYYLHSTNYHANTYMFNEFIQKHPKLQWLMLVAASPGIGKQFHQWIPHIRDRVTKLKEVPKVKELKDYYKKIYKGTSDSILTELASETAKLYEKKVFLANEFTCMKHTDIALLAELITDADIDEYKSHCGNTV